MSEPAPAAEVNTNGVRNYTGLCFCAMLAVLMGLVQRGVGWWSAFPVLLGMLTLAVRWRIGPILVLSSLGVLLFGPVILSLGRAAPQFRPQLGDLVISLGVLCYVAGHYRLQGLVGNIFPGEVKRAAETRRGQRGPAALRGQPRSPTTATVAELVLLLASLPAWVGLALVIYPRLLTGAGGLLGIHDQSGDRLFNNFMNDLANQSMGSVMANVFVGSLAEVVEAAWQCRVLILLTSFVVLGVWGVVRYLAWQTWTPAEAKMALQDGAWKETRGEQRRINSWTMWARQRRKGGS